MVLQQKYLYFFLCCFSTIFTFDIVYQKVEHNKESGELTITASYNAKEFILADSLHCMVTPYNQTATIIFVERLGEIYSIEKKSFLNVLHGQGTLQFVLKNFVEQITACTITYSTFDPQTNMLETNKKIVFSPDPINQYLVKEETPEPMISSKEISQPIPIEQKGLLDKNNIPSTLAIKEKNFIEKITDKAKNFNLFIVALITFFLGLLMSFTPCIYPMIPITISILGIDQQPTNQKILSATLYVFGIAITFSILGLFAASGKLFFGALFSKQWFVLLFAALFTFMTLNMLGIIDSLSFLKTQIDLPDWIQNHPALPFFYGIFSGTITSPCISPGLFAVLTIVADKGNLFIGWFWLFTFGLGLGLPLWLIAVLFNQINIFPQSGAWMVQLKEIIGFLLLFTLYFQIYQLNHFWATFFILLLLFVFLIKKYMSFEQIPSEQKYWFFSFSIFIAFYISCFFIYQLFLEYQSIHKAPLIQWVYDIETAKVFAAKEQKIILIDFTADWCSSCKVIEKKIFEDEKIISSIKNKVIFCKIDCTKEKKTTVELMQKHNISGLPTILLLSPNNENHELKRYTSAITEKEKNILINEINTL